MNTLRTGLIGHNISRTRLPAALKIMCDHAGLTLDFTPIDTADLPNFDFGKTVDRLRNEGWTSVTVTHPYKTAARQYVGAGMVNETNHLLSCNTLRFETKTKGFNTDFTGFLAAWANKMGDVAPGRVTLMGAGGVAQAIGPALKSLDAEHINIIDTDPYRSAALQAEIGHNSLALLGCHTGTEIRRSTGLVNATPMGMAEHPGSAFDLNNLGGQQTWAFDAVYTPVWTPFLSAARDAGLKTLTGFDLFKAMALRTFEAKTGLTLDHSEILPQLDPLQPA